MDISKLIKEAKPHIKLSVLDVIFNNIEYNCIGNMGRYAFASKKDISITLQAYKEYPNLESYIAEIEAYIQDKYIGLCNKFEKDGYSQIEFITSEEYAKEVLLTNGYEFTKDGKEF